MKTVINQSRFLKAIEHVSKNHFSKAYSITPIVNRWFNQLSMIELENGKLIHLSGEVAREFVDIILDGMVVDPKDIELVHKFHAQNSTHETDRVTLETTIQNLTTALNGIPDDSSEKELKRKELEEEKQKLIQFDEDKLKAKQLYDDIVARGRSVLNEERLENQCGSKIKHIVHRPNHGLTHSVRVAYLITSLHAFNQEHNKDSKLLNDSELEKLQMMMLFSVVGRKDETGWSDTGPYALGRVTYESFRTTSGREFVKYFRDNAKVLYGDDLDKLYRDAIVVELMGYSTIQDCIDRKISPPAVFIDYVIEKEASLGRTVTREQAITLITTKTYSLDKLYPNNSDIRALADAKLDMMNDAHGIDLTRCYPLYPTKAGGAKSIGVLNSYMIRSGIYQVADLAKLESVFNIMRCSFDTLILTGQHSKFGFISKETFEIKKHDVLQTINDINQRFQKPISNENRKTLFDEIKVVRTEPNYYNQLEGAEDNNLLESYRKHLILEATVKCFTDAPELKPNKCMFQFQHSEEGNPHKINHHQNAISFIQALQTVIPMNGLTQPEVPVISKVKHHREKNTVTVFFEDKQQAELFKENYVNLFSSIFLVIPDIIEKEGIFSLEIDRIKYKQLLEDKLIEFKEVTIPKEITREDSLTDPRGTIEALNLIKNSRALVRLVSTTPLSGETFPDYEYLLNELEDPVHERYTPSVRELKDAPVEEGKYFDPRNNILYVRQRVPTSIPELRFQEPITEPRKFEDRLTDGWILGTPGGERNTIYTKKRAHTLLPPHGEVIPFAGYADKKWNYFPIGVLSDIRYVDSKDYRYVWAQNMDTVNKFWIRDVSVITKRMYKLFNAKLDNLGNLENGKIIFDVKKLHRSSNPKSLDPIHFVEYLEKRKARIIEALDTKHYFPTKEIIKNFKWLLSREKANYLDRFKDNEEVKNKIEEVYDILNKRLEQEKAKKHPKYAITLRKLIEQQQNTVGVENHTEILVGNTKGATRAFYATKDELFDRLNLALHAMKIKEKYHYDVPLLVVSQNKAPYHYTEEMIKADLKEAYALLRKGEFPYDKTRHQAYELDEKGNAILVNGKRVPKKDQNNELVFVEKNQEYQQEVLVNLFQLGLYHLDNIGQLEKGEIIPNETLDGEIIEIAIDSIIEKMDILGGLARETKLMQPIFSQDNMSQKEKFFLRQAALGHLSLMLEMLDKEDFKVSMPLLEKAIQFAEKNSHIALKEFLEIQCKTIEEIKTGFKNLKSIESIEPTALADHILVLVNLNQQYQPIQNRFVIPELDVMVPIKAEELLLNNLSRNKENRQELTKFMELLSTHPEYVEPYAAILAADKTVALKLLLESHQQLGVELTTQIMSLIASYDTEEVKLDQLIDTLRHLLTRGIPPNDCQNHLENVISHIKDSSWDWNDARNYLLLLELNKQDIAQSYLQNKNVLFEEARIEEVQSQIKFLIQEIKKNGMGHSDQETKNYCQGMTQVVEKNKEDYLFLALQLQDVIKVYKAIISPEMGKIKGIINDLKAQTFGLFSGSWAKASKITEAICQVPLPDRSRIFSCENVLETLALCGITKNMDTIEKVERNTLS